MFPCSLLFLVMYDTLYYYYDKGSLIRLHAVSVVSHEYLSEAGGNPIDSHFEQTEMRTTNIGIYLYHCMVTLISVRFSLNIETSYYDHHHI